MKLVQITEDMSRTGRLQQKGAGGYTLCERCNSLTGKWYGSYFPAWCYQGMSILDRTNQRSGVYVPYWIRPLAVLKQIIAMFFSVNTESFRKKHGELVEFVLDRDRKYLSSRYHVHSYFTLSPRARMIGVAGTIGRSHRSTVGVLRNLVSAVRLRPIVPSNPTGSSPC